MLSIQASIGALNDVADARWDAGRKPGKPIPRGAAGPGLGRAVWALGLLGGLALSAPSGIATVVVAAAGAACGYAYDLRLSRTPLSWLPLAIALPLLPIHAWLGVTGALPSGGAGLVPIGVLAGTGLALANGVVDVERDRAAGTRTIAVALGRSVAWRVHAAALAGAIALATWLVPATPSALVPAGIGLGTLVVGAGAVALRSGDAQVRERGWEAEAIGVAVLGAAWLAGVAAGSAR